MPLKYSDSIDLVRSVLDRVESKNFTEAVEVLKDEDHAGHLKNKCWDLIPVLCLKLEEPESRAGCKDLLEILAGKADPEEAVLEFLERIEEASPGQFPVLLPLLKSCLLREDVTNRRNMLEWSLNSTRSYLEQISSVEHEEAKDDQVRNSVECTLTFLEDFIAFVDDCQGDPEKDTIKLLLASRLIQLCDMFLPFISAGNLDEVTVKTCNLVLKLMPDPCILFNHILNRALKRKSCQKSKKFKDLRDVQGDEFDTEHRLDFEEEAVISDLSYGIFFYILVSETHNPLVYHSKYTFLSLAVVVVPFFENSVDESSHAKGLHFLNFLLDRLHEKLNKRDLCFETHHKLLVHLNNLMIYSEVEKNRRDALKNFRNYLFSFDYEARYWLLFYLRKHVQHPGTCGYLITVMKDFLLEFASLPAESEAFKKFYRYYEGKLLFDLIKKYCFLTEGSDLVECADQVISSLNLLRFLILKGKHEMDLIGKINDDFLKPLEKCVFEAKRHYSAQLKNLDEKEREDSSPVVQVAVKNNLLPNLTKEQEKAACLSSLNALDLVNSLLMRVSELIDDSRVRCLQRCHSAAKSDRDADKRSKEQEYEDDIKEKILEASLPFVQDLGWSKEALANGAESLGYPGLTNGIFPNFEVDLIHYFNKKCNGNLMDHMRNASSSDPRILTEDAIKARLKMIEPFIHKWGQALAILSLPPNVPLALNNYACLIDEICHHAGDQSVDFNWYTTRFAVGGIYKATELCLIQDKSAGHEETWQFLSRRMQEAFWMKEFFHKSADAAENTGQLIVATLTTAKNIFRLNQPR